VVELDLTSDKSVSDAIDRIVKERKRIDVLVNNSGYEQGGALEDDSMDQIKSLFETNLFSIGVVKILRSSNLYVVGYSSYSMQHCISLDSGFLRLTLYIN
jgi:NAD(P)-dependent dehydrogenase (short-subunit alcohol dehydrogenase family)